MGDSNDLFATFCIAKRIADMPYTKGYFTPKGGVGSSLPSLYDRRDVGANPYYSQTASGLFLEIYYGGPGKIWTPWGHWECWGGGDLCEEATARFLSHLHLEVHQVLTVTKMGEIGPIYKILAVESETLPTPVVREQSDYLDYKTAKAGWAEMCKRFESKAA